MSNAGSPGAIRFAADVEVVTGRDGRTLLLGGSPLRMMRLTEAGARWVGDARHPIVTPGAVDRLAWRMIDAKHRRARHRCHPRRGGRRMGRAEDTAVVIPVRPGG
jgi:hypothetical protein